MSNRRASSTERRAMRPRRPRPATVAIDEWGQAPWIVDADLEVPRAHCRRASRRLVRWRLLPVIPEKVTDQTVKERPENRASSENATDMLTRCCSEDPANCQGIHESRSSQ